MSVTLTEVTPAVVAEQKKVARCWCHFGSEEQGLHQAGFDYAASPAVAVLPGALPDP